MTESLLIKNLPAEIRAGRLRDDTVGQRLECARQGYYSKFRIGGRIGARFFHARHRHLLASLARASPGFRFHFKNLCRRKYISEGSTLIPAVRAFPPPSKRQVKQRLNCSVQPILSSAMRGKHSEGKTLRLSGAEARSTNLVRLADGIDQS